MSDQFKPLVIYDYIIARLDTIRTEQPNRVCVFYLLLGSYPGYYMENPADETRLHCCPQIIPSLDSYIENLHQEVIHCDELYKLKPQTVLQEHTHQPQTPGNTFDQSILDYRFPIFRMRSLIDRLAQLPAFFYVQNTTGIPFPFDEFAYMEQRTNVYFTVSDCMLNTLEPINLPMLNVAAGRWENQAIIQYVITNVEIPLLIDVCKCILIGESVHHITARDRQPVNIANTVTFDTILPQQLDMVFEIYLRPYLFHRLTGNIRLKYLAKYLSGYIDIAEKLDADESDLVSGMDAWLEPLAQFSPEANAVCNRIHHLFNTFLDQLLSSRSAGSLQQIPLIKFLIMILLVRQLQVTNADTAPKYLPVIEYLLQQMLSPNGMECNKELKQVLINW
jgi:hypothetical protein